MISPVMTSVISAVTSAVTSTVTGKAKADAAAVAAADQARAALVEEVGAADVGAHLGHAAEGERVVTHQFECTRKGYVGWRWSVTVARASRQKTVTVDEVVKALGWQTHTVRGAIAGALKKKLRLNVSSEKVDGRGRVYRITD